MYQTTKPKKPVPDFPLFAHNNGSWAKKIKGKLCYFGPWSDPETALENYRQSLQTRTPTIDTTVKALVTIFLEDKQALVALGELSHRTLDYYRRPCKLLLSVIGNKRTVSTLGPQDFKLIRQEITKNWGTTVTGNAVQVIRSVFIYGEENELIEKKPKYGSHFKKPSQKAVRKTRQEKGPTAFTPDEIHRLLNTASINVRAMILLGINCALGNTDVGQLTGKELDLESGWMNYPRPKTGINRKIPLWPETVQAIVEAIRYRSTPVSPKESELVFIGKRGKGYACNQLGYRVTQAFNVPLKQTDIKGHSFYDLRRTFQTIGEEAKDLPAVQSIMGHAPPGSDMSAIYRQCVTDERLLDVTNYVHSWLYKKPYHPGKPR